jgi:hypothetical protein
MCCPQYGCNVGVHSCPTIQQTSDPVHNVMGYSNDACMDGFTPDQITRMWAAWYKYRSPNRSAAT